MQLRSDSSQARNDYAWEYAPWSDVSILAAPPIWFSGAIVVKPPSRMSGAARTREYRHSKLARNLKRAVSNSIGAVKLRPNLIECSCGQIPRKLPMTTLCSIVGDSSLHSARSSFHCVLNDRCRDRYKRHLRHFSRVARSGFRNDCTCGVAIRRPPSAAWRRTA